VNISQPKLRSEKFDNNNKVYEEGDVTVLWNQAVHIDRAVTANRPDIIIKNKKEKTCTDNTGATYRSNIPVKHENNKNGFE